MLLVFSYLVIPAVVAMLFADRIGTRLLIGWIVGHAGQRDRLLASPTSRDLPSGPTIVACFGGALVVAGLAHYVLVHGAPAHGRALARVVGGAIAVAALVSGSFLLRKQEHFDIVHVLQTGNKAECTMALGEVGKHPELWAEVRPLVPGLLAKADTEVRDALISLVEKQKDASLLAAVESLLTDPRDSLRESALRCVRAIGAKTSVPALVAAAAKEEDDYLRVEFGEALLELGQLSGVQPIFQVLKSGEAAEARKDAWEHLKAHIPLPPELGPTDLSALEHWWSENEKRLVPGGAGVFKLGP